MAIRGKEMESLLSGCDLSRAAPMFRSTGPMGEMRRILALAGEDYEPFALGQQGCFVDCAVVAGAAGDKMDAVIVAGKCLQQAGRIGPCDLSRAAPMFRSPGPMGEMRRILADVCATSIIPAAVDQLFPYYLRGPGAKCPDAF